MLDPHREIHALVDRFIADLRALARRRAIEQINVAFEVGANLSAAVDASRSTGARRAAAKRVGNAALRRDVGSGAKRGAGVPASRTRRSREHDERKGEYEGEHEGEHEIEALRDRLLAAIAEVPGRRTEDLNQALGTTTRQIAQVLRRLITENQVRTEGARRGARYFAVAGDAQNDRRPEPATTETPAPTAGIAVAAAAEATAVAGEPPGPTSPTL